MAENDNTTNNQEDSDFQRVNTFIRDQVRSYAQEAFAEQAARSQQQPQQQLTQEQAAREQLRQTLDPFITPQLQEAQLEARATRDYVDFYSDPSNLTDKDTVEEMFNNLIKAGKPLPRKDIADYLNGKLARENPQEFSKKMSERQQRQLERAGGAVDIGAGALDRARNDPRYSRDALSKMTADELGELLDGITF